MSENSNEGCGGVVVMLVLLILVGLLIFWGVKSCHSPAETPSPSCPVGAAERTKGCDEFTVLSPRVEKEGALWTDAGWHPLSAGETLSVDSGGEAELNFSECWPGHLYAFEKSSGDFRVKHCRKFMSDSGSFWCFTGFWYVSCEGEYTLRTGSAQIEKQGTTLWVMYLPDKDNLTLVVVLEGEVEVRPVEDYPSTLGSATTLTAEEFYFTMPDAEMHDIAGLAPRSVYPYAELEPLVGELGIEDWIGAAVEQAQRDGFSVSRYEYARAEEAEEEEDKLPGYSIFSVGGVLEYPEFQEVVLLAVDWSETTFAGDVIVAWIGEEKVDVLADLSYDPDAARVLLDEQGYEAIPSLKIFYEQDEDLAAVAEIVAEFLLENRFAENVEVEEESPAYLGAEPAIFLKRIR